MVANEGPKANNNINQVNRQLHIRWSTSSFLWVELQCSSFVWASARNYQGAWQWHTKDDEVDDKIAQADFHLDHAHFILQPHQQGQAT